VKNTYPINQFAPAYLQGVMTPPPGQVGFEDKYFDYVFDPRGGQILLGTDPIEELQIDQDADFYFTGLLITKMTADFLVQITDASGFELTDGFISSTTLSACPSFPTQLGVKHPLPAGSKLVLHFREISATDNALQLVFKGYKRYRRSMESAA